MARRPLDLEDSAKLDTVDDPNLESSADLDTESEVSLDAEDSSEELSATDENAEVEEGEAADEKQEEKSEEKEEDSQEAAEGEEAQIEDEDIPAGPGPDPIDLGGGKMLKPEDFKDPKLFEQVRRGYLREADYTRKTQEHAKMVDGAANIWSNYKSIQENPCPPLLNWFRPEQLLRSLAQAGYDVDPQLLGSNGGAQPNGQGHGQAQPTQDPQLVSRLKNLETQNAEYQKNTIAAEIDSTISDCLKDIKSPEIRTYIRNRTLSNLWSNPSANVREITLQTRETVRKERAGTVLAKKGKMVGTRVGKTTGGSVPVMGKKEFKTFEEAQEAGMRRLGA